MSATATFSKRLLSSTLRRGLFQSPGSRCLNTVARRPDRPFRMAVIGAGPAGFYTAYRVLGKLANSRVDMYESLPVPYGLVRFGVAPDHPEVKVSLFPLFNFRSPHHQLLTTQNKRPRTVKTNSTRWPKTHASRTSETLQSAHPGHTHRIAASH